MPAINAGNLSLLDLVKRTAPDGSPAILVEQLSQMNAILMDAVFKEGNLPTGERVSSRTGLPAIGWKRYNEGIAPSKSRVDQWDEACGRAGGMSAVDVELANLGGNAPAYRASEDAGFVQAFNNEIETAFFYHSTKTSPERFMGLSPRFDSTTEPGGAQIIKHDPAAAGADQTSVWLIGWGDQTVYGITPKGRPGGLTPHDMGEQLWDDGTGKKFRAYVTDWDWQLGLVVKDWRYVVRIANIDWTNLSAAGGALIDSMIRAYHQLYGTSGVRCAWYCNRQVSTYLHLQAKNAVTNSTLSIEKVGGQPVTTFLGIPVRRTDGLLNTEAVIN